MATDWNIPRGKLNEAYKLPVTNIGYASRAEIEAPRVTQYPAHAIANLNRKRSHGTAGAAEEFTGRWGGIGVGMKRKKA